MATTVAVPTTSQIPVSDVSVLNTEYVVFSKAKTDKAGQPEKDKNGNQAYVTKVIATPSEEQEAKLVKDGFKKLGSQVLVIPTVLTDEGFKALIPDKVERNAIADRGIKQKSTQHAAKNLGALNDDGSPKWAFSESPKDISDWLNTVTSRRNLTPEQRAVRDLKNNKDLPRELVASMIKALFVNRDAELQAALSAIESEDAEDEDEGETPESESESETEAGTVTV
jgi:hypothetical protein